MLRRQRSRHPAIPCMPTARRRSPASAPAAAARRRSWPRRLLRWLLLLILSGVAASVLLVLSLRWLDPPTSGIQIARAIEASVRGDRSYRALKCWRDLDQLGTALPIAVIASEDQRFAEHFGFDLEELRKALAAARTGEKLRGASTLSQQTAKNLFLWPGRSWVRKGLEAWFTVLIELTWPKQRILEVYLNIVEFGDGVFGGCAAAAHYWGIEAQALSPQRAARLAAALPNPHVYRVEPPSPYVLERAQWILGQIRNLGGAQYLDGLDTEAAAPPKTPPR